MKEKTDQEKQIKPEPTSLETLELKANLNSEHREYLDVLKDKMKKVLGNKTKQAMAKAGDLASLKNYQAVLKEILEFLQTKEMKNKLESFGGKKILAPQAKILEAIALQIAYRGKKRKKGNLLDQARLFLSEHCAIDEKGNIKVLNVQSLGLRSLPDLKDLAELNRFICSNNNLTDLPGIGELVNLEILSCHHNYIERMPNLTRLKKLKELDCRNNPIDSVGKNNIRWESPFNCDVQF